MNASVVHHHLQWVRDALYFLLAVRAGRYLSVATAEELRLWDKHHR